MLRAVFLGVILGIFVSGQIEAEAAAWTKDDKNRAVINGQPVFLRIAYDRLFDSTTAAGHIATRNLQDYGFNVYLHLMFGTQENGIRQLPALPQSMFGVAIGNAFAEKDVDRMSFLNGPFDLVANPNNFRSRFNAEPKAGGAYLADEPQVSVLDNVSQWSTTYKTGMPNTPLLVVTLPMGPLIPADGPGGSIGWQEYVTAATGTPAANVYWWARNVSQYDWIGDDPYPLSKDEAGLAPWGYPHFWVADRAAHTVAAAELHGKVPIVVLQLFGPFFGGRFITPDELWSHMVMSVAEGARGIGWWHIGRGNGLRGQLDSDRIPVDDALKTITLLLRDLEPIILTDPNPALLVGNSTATGNSLQWRKNILPAMAEAIRRQNFVAGGRATYVAEGNALNDGVTAWSPMLDQGGDVRTRAWERRADGVGVVFAYNYHPNERLGVKLTWHTPIARVDVLGEGRSIMPEADGISWVDNYGGSTSFNMGGRRIGHIYQVIPVVPPPPPPVTLTFTSPGDGAAVDGTITVSLEAGGGTGTFSNYTVTLDGTTTLFSGAAPSFSWNTTTVASGAHTLNGTVTDSGGGSATATRNITVNHAPPPMIASITAPATGATVRSSTTINMAVANSATTWNVFNLTDNGHQIFNHSAPATTDSFVWSLLNVANGSHTVVLTVKDFSEPKMSATTQIVLDVANAIAASFTSPPQGVPVTGVVTVGMAVTGDTSTWGHTFNLTVDGNLLLNQWVAGTTNSVSWNSATVANGVHTLAVTITDGVGKSTTASIDVTVAN